MPRSIAAGPILVFTLALVPPGSSQADPGPQPPRVEWHDGRLSVEADGVGFQGLVAAVAEETAVEVHGLASVGDSASVHFVDLTLRDGLEALLAGANHVMTEEPAAHGGPARLVVRLLGHKSRPDSDAPGEEERSTDAPEPISEDGTGADPTEEPTTVAGPDAYRSLELLAEQGDIQALREAAAFGDATTRALALQRLAREDPFAARRLATEAAGSAEAAHRALAMQVLGGMDGATATAALGAGLQDSDPEVRCAALTGLTGRTSPTAIQFLVEALQDRDVSVRSLALDLLAQTAAAGMPAVRSALEDEDRGLAARPQQALKGMGPAE